MSYKDLECMFQSFCEAWPMDAQYYIWGAGNNGRNFLARMNGRICIAGFIDSDPGKWNAQFEGYPVFSPQDCLVQRQATKILIASMAYMEIIPELERWGLEEKKDFCDCHMFESIHAWHTEKKVCLRRTDVSITTFCTLKCKECNMLIPYYQKRSHKSVEQILEDMDCYFQWVDYVETFYLLGGEPFLHPQVSEITKAIVKRYSSKIGTLTFFTNGTILPEENLLAYMGQNGVHVQISDYRRGLPELAPKVEVLIEALEHNKVPYSLDQLDTWDDFRHPEPERPGWSLEQIEQVCAKCYSPYRGLHDKKFYYCHINTSAARSGLYSEDSGDYISLVDPTPTKKRELVAFDLGFLPNGATSYCRYCGGCSPMNQKKTPVAEQLV